MSEEGPIRPLFSLDYIKKQEKKRNGGKRKYTKLEIEYFQKISLGIREGQNILKSTKYPLSKVDYNKNKAFWDDMYDDSKLTEDS